MLTLKKITQKTILILLALIMVASVTACQQAVQDDNDSTRTSVSETDQTSANITEVSYENENTGITGPEETDRKELIFNSEEHIELCTSEIKSGNDTYEIKTFLFDRIEETAGEIKGDVAFELYKNGERINTLSPIIGYLGQVGKTYEKNKPEDYFNVIKLDGGEVFTVTYPEDNGLMTTAFLTVKDGKLTLMERYLTDEEKKRLEADPHEYPITSRTCFNTVKKFGVKENCITYTLENEITNIGEDKDAVYPAGEIPLTFDFKNSIVKCEKDEYAGMVYYY